MLLYEWSQGLPLITIVYWFRLDDYLLIFKTRTSRQRKTTEYYQYLFHFSIPFKVKLSLNSNSIRSERGEQDRDFCPASLLSISSKPLLRSIPNSYKHQPKYILCNYLGKQSLTAFELNRLHKQNFVRYSPARLVVWLFWCSLLPLPLCSPFSLSICPTAYKPGQWSG